MRNPSLTISFLRLAWSGQVHYGWRKRVFSQCQKPVSRNANDRPRIMKLNGTQRQGVPWRVWFECTMVDTEYWVLSSCILGSIKAMTNKTQWERPSWDEACNQLPRCLVHKRVALQKVLSIDILCYIGISIVYTDATKTRLLHTHTNKHPTSEPVGCRLFSSHRSWK